MDIFERIVSQLNNEELSRLNSAVYNERRKRLDADVRKGDYPKPLVEELLQFKDGLKLQAIKAYRAREGMTIEQSLRIFEFHTS